MALIFGVSISMALMTAFWEFSFRIKIVPDELLYKTRKFMRIDHVV